MLAGCASKNPIQGPDARPLSLFIATYIGYIHIFTTFEAIIKLNDYAI